MTLKSPLSVRIERPKTSLGDAMSEIRTWLDDHKIQPVEFRSSPSVSGTSAFEIRFNRVEEARFFEQTFAQAQ